MNKGTIELTNIQFILKSYWVLGFGFWVLGFGIHGKYGL